MKNLKNRNAAKLTLRELSEQYPEHYYYFVFAMYQEAYKRLMQLKYQDINNMLIHSIHKCEEFLEDIGKYLQTHQNTMVDMQPFAQRDIREIAETFQVFTEYTMSTQCIYNSATQHPLYKNLKCIILLIDIMLKELMHFEAQVNINKSLNSNVTHGS